MTNPLDGAWELVSGQLLPEGARDIKILSEGHFIFAAYDTETGKPLYTAGGTYTLNGSAYTEHMNFASEKMGHRAHRQRAVIHYTDRWKQFHPDRHAHKRKASEGNVEATWLNRSPLQRHRNAGICGSELKH